jgi:hypothetical protein
VVFSSEIKQRITREPVSMDIHCKDSKKLPAFIRSGMKLKFPTKVKDHDLYKSDDGEKKER